MYDIAKVQELQNKSHIRGVLFKEMHYGQQQELQRKRREMKAILDKQVEEKRKQKEMERRKHEKLIENEENKIQTYYQSLQSREKKVLQNSYPQQSNRTGGSRVRESKVSIQQRYKNNKNTADMYAHGDIPVMPVMQATQKVAVPIPPPSNPPNRLQESINNSQQSQPYHRNPEQKHQAQNAAHIPLLELEDRKKVKNKNPKQHKNSFGDQELSAGGSRQPTELKEVFGDINEQLENENRELKKELKKNQEAISLLIGAVRSNAKFDKFRVQAERILHGNSKELAESKGKKGDEQAEKSSLLPKLKLRHQSIMHDYMFGSAKKAIVKGKTYK